ncbi:MAG: flavin reductase family protein [Porticoccaceae bacterium]|tara:strand:- start:670 stop:1191 length:522 start_codon:yes stop_codon:yes gene_type:complete
MRDINMATNTESFEDTAITPASLREALGSFPTGVAVVTTLSDDGKPIGLTVNSFNSVSLEPALVLWSLALSSPSIGAFRKHRAFAVNILRKEQEDLCMKFARPADDKFTGVNWTDGYRGIPVLDGAMVTLECEMYQIVEGGDHEVYMGTVKRIHKTDSSPLVFHRGQLVQLAS